MNKLIKKKIIAFLLFIFLIQGNANSFDIKAPTAILQDYLSGEILFEKDPDRSIYPASMTKIMTSIVAFDLASRFFFFVPCVAIALFAFLGSVAVFSTLAVVVDLLVDTIPPFSSDSVAVAVFRVVFVGFPFRVAVVIPAVLLR